MDQVTWSNYKPAEVHAQHEQPLETSKADPPGYDIPQARQREWWLSQQQMEHKRTYETSKRRQQHRMEEFIQRSAASDRGGMGNGATPIDRKQSHSYKEYIRSRRKNRGRDMDESDADAIFSWVPQVRNGLGKVSSSSHGGIGGNNYRSQAAQQVFESTVPKRSWNLHDGEGDDGDENRTYSGEETVLSGFEGNSWVMPRPTIKRDKIDAAATANTTTTMKKEEEEEIIDEEEVITEDDDEEVLVDEDGNTIEEEEVLEEEEEKVIIDEQGNEIIEEEVLSSSWPANSTSEGNEQFVDRKKAVVKPPNRGSWSVSSSQPNPFMPPKPTNTADESVSSDGISHSPSSSSTRSRTEEDRAESVASKEDRPEPVTSVISNNDSFTSSGNNNKSSDDRRSSSDDTTNDSGSTQVLYIRDPHDLDEILMKCFDGGEDVRIEDGHADDDDDSHDDDTDFAPSKQMLIFLALLVALVAVSIILGVSIYFKR